MNHAPWPGFRDGSLVLSLPDDWFDAPAISLEIGTAVLELKPEFHVTLLDRACGSLIEAALGESKVRAIFEAEDWTLSQTGDGAALRKYKSQNDLLCSSLIELINLPAMASFRSNLTQAASIELADTPPHVTLYTAGDPKGIGVPSHQALYEGTVATLRLPGIANRSAPPLSENQRAAYFAADYALDSIGVSAHIGERCAVVDEELAERNVERATIVTAYNPFSSNDDDTANTIRQQWLLAFLRSEGLPYIPAEDRDPDGNWNSEPSVLVLGTTPALEERLLRDFEQHAVVALQKGEPARLIFHPDVQ